MGARSETVTMLFTDIEGSTRLARTLGAAWDEVLERHHAILRRVIEEHAGAVEGTDGDAFFALFTSAREALTAASEAQRALDAHPWPAEPVRVRMGVHTGDVRRTATGLVGIEIHRSARVAASAHGGQVLLTAATRASAGEGVLVQDLGLHRLKDFPEPERLFHLVIDGRDAAAFPPPRTLPVRPTNVPVLETLLVGRRQELEVLYEALGNGTRLVTLTGPGGTGKTRLALAAAERLLDVCPGGAWFVPLADAPDATTMLSGVGESLGVAADGTRPLLAAVAERLREERTLLVLDNLEQLRDAPAVVAELLDASPAVRVLATSQAPLRITAERVMPLSPLDGAEASELFIESARRRRPDFDPVVSAPAIEAICERLDGLPLAIELAAARTVLLTPEELLERLSGSLDLLRARERDRPSRHRSLRAAIEWSFGLLADEVRALCATLSVFAAPFTLADAEALAGGDVIDGVEELLECSFLRRVEAEGGESAFTMAQTLREFARERLLAADLLDDVQARHLEWAIGLAADATRSRGRAATAAAARVRAHAEDLFAALRWARDRDPPGHLRLAGLTGEAIEWAARFSEVAAELERALERAPAVGPDLARAHTVLGLLRVRVGASAEGAAHLERAAELWGELGDGPAEVRATSWLVAPALSLDPRCARGVAERALMLARELADPLLIDEAVMWLAQVDVAAGEVGRVEPLLAEALTRVEESYTGAMARHLYADCALIRGDGAEAARRYADAIRRFPIPDGDGISVELQGLAMALAVAGDHPGALEVSRIARAWEDHLDYHQDIPFWTTLIERHVGAARAALPDYVAEQPLDDLGAARDWALARVDALGAVD